MTTAIKTQWSASGQYVWLFNNMTVLNATTTLTNIMSPLYVMCVLHVVERAH